MDVVLEHGPGNAVARLTLSPGETCTAEAGAMIAMSGNMAVTTTTHKKGQAGLFKAMKRMVAGESFFLNHFEPQQTTGEVCLGTTLSGDMLSLDLDSGLVVQAGSFVACEHSVDMDLGWQGIKNLVSGESLFWLHMSGRGKLVLGAFGAIYPVDVDGEALVDTGHIVAFDDTLDFSLSKAGGSWLHSWLGGEGLVCRFKGRGRVWCQSHSPSGFGHRLTPMLRPRKA